MISTMSAVLFVACIILASETGAEVLRVNVGDKVTFSVVTWPHDTFTCHLVTPHTGTISFDQTESWDKSKYELKSTSIVGCMIDLTVTGVDDSGLWQMFVTADNTTLYGTNNTIKVIIPDNDNTLEDVTEPEPAQNWDIEWLAEEFIDTQINVVHNITVSKFAFVETESCHLTSKDGKEYKMPKVPTFGIEWIQGENIACGIKFKVKEHLIGHWMLFTKEIRFSSSKIERRLPFVIYVEETVAASPREVLIAEGNDLHVRLENSAGELQDTCKLHAPEGIKQVLYEIDKLHHSVCGYTIKNVSHTHAGVWHIKYGKGIMYKAPIHVFVKAPVNATVDSRIEWIRNTMVDMNMGPDNAIYCKAVDPTGRVVFDKFYKCHIHLQQPEENHQGIWTLTVGMPGKIVTEEYKVQVTLTAPVQKPEVITRVEKQGSHALLSCGLPKNQNAIRWCKFLDPSGKVLLATHGVGEDRYSFHGVNVTLNSKVETRSCDMRISNPTREDLGLWRCTIETEFYEVYYGFLNVDEAMSNSSVTVIAEPKLTPTKRMVSGPEGSTIMSCKIQSSIRYCYFRATNGTIYNINQGVITDKYEYAGLGFQSGDCSVRFKHLLTTDSGEWSCHVGQSSNGLPEQRAFFTVNIYRPYGVLEIANQNGNYIIYFYFHQPTRIEYCRFVRSDGLGFSLDNVPSSYFGIQSLDGSCTLTMFKPTLIDRHPWTVVARVKGRTDEVSEVTNGFLKSESSNLYSWSAWFAIFLILLSVTAIALMVMLLDRENYKKWKVGRLTAIRNSFRFNRKNKLHINGEQKNTQVNGETP